MDFGILAGLGQAATAGGQGVERMAATQRDDAMKKHQEEAAQLMQDRIYERTRADTLTDQKTALANQRTLADEQATRSLDTAAKLHDQQISQNQTAANDIANVVAERRMQAEGYKPDVIKATLADKESRDTWLADDSDIPDSQKFSEYAKAAESKGHRDEARDYRSLMTAATANEKAQAALEHQYSRENKTDTQYRVKALGDAATTLDHEITKLDSVIANTLDPAVKQQMQTQLDTLRLTQADIRKQQINFAKTGELDGNGKTSSGSDPFGLKDNGTDNKTDNKKAEEDARKKAKAEEDAKIQGILNAANAAADKNRIPTLADIPYESDSQKRKREFDAVANSISTDTPNNRYGYSR